MDGIDPKLVQQAQDKAMAEYWTKEYMLWAARKAKEDAIIAASMVNVPRGT